METEFLEPASETPRIHTHEGYRIEKTITILREPFVLYSFWRNLENLPVFMSHLESVTMLDDDYSLWVARGPAGLTFEWEAKIIGDRPDKMIAWRSLEESDITIAGSVWFLPEFNGKATRLRICLKYQPRGGRLANAIASMMGENPDEQIEEDLNQLKYFMEANKADAYPLNA